MSSKQNQLDVINNEVTKCRSCGFCENRNKTVFGEGNVDSSVLFCGEAPGKSENESGRPFVGRAGKLLDNMIASMGFARSDVYIANICKCQPPNNRKPNPSEMDACKPFLFSQIEIIRPKFIIALGNTALGGLTGQDGGIVSRCGNWEEININNTIIKLMPVFHPSALLRNPNWKEPAWYALQKVAKEFV